MLGALTGFKRVPGSAADAWDSVSRPRTPLTLGGITDLTMNRAHWTARWTLGVHTQPPDALRSLPRARFPIIPVSSGPGDCRNSC